MVLQQIDSDYGFQYYQMAKYWQIISQSCISLPNKLKHYYFNNVIYCRHDKNTALQI